MSWINVQQQLQPCILYLWVLLHAHSTHSDTVQLQLMWAFDYLEKLVEHRSNGVFSPVLLRCWNIYDPCRALLPHCAAEVVHSARGSECLETYVQRTFDDFWSLVFKKINIKKINKYTTHLCLPLLHRWDHYWDHYGWNNQTGVCNRGMHKKKLKYSFAITFLDVFDYTQATTQLQSN